MLDNFGHRASAQRDDGGSARHRFDHHEPKGLGPIDRKQQHFSVAEELLLLTVADLADVFHERIVEERLDDAFEILAVHGVHFRRDPKRQPDALRDRDRSIDTLLGRHSPDEGEILPGLGSKAVQVMRQAVVHGA